MSSRIFSTVPKSHLPQEKVWWSNAVFFLSVHFAALIGVYYHPWYAVPRQTLVLCILLWQAACFGVTIGYHRLYSHRAFRAAFGVRVVLACLGASAFQGSIKWWCLRHRLHHRYTDDPVHDPYCATRGLLWSHMGWIFFKPKYERMALIERDDLDSDPVVRIQHEYYVPFAIITGFVLPPLIGALWGDTLGAFIWGSLVARLMIWHCTFLVNSLAHWDGIQPFTDENTSKTNLILALLTCGEGNHNFRCSWMRYARTGVSLTLFSQPTQWASQHAFPHDFRSGPSYSDWDPSKWIIFTLHRIGLVTGLRRARAVDVTDAIVYMHQKHNHHIPTKDYDDFSCSSDGDSLVPAREVWNDVKLEEYVKGKKGRCVIVVKGYVVDVTTYMGEHPGGAAFLRKYAFRPSDSVKEADGEEGVWKEATWAFYGGMNQHTRSAKKRMREFIVARYQE